MKQLIIIFCIWLILFLLFANSGLINPDGVAHYSFLRSLLFDRDLLFFNEYAHYGFQPGAAYLTSSEHLSNIWSIGPAVLWLPFVSLGHLFSYLLGWFGLDFGQDGYSVSYIAYGVKLGSALLGLCVVLLLYRIGETISGSRRLFPALWFLFGTPLLFYAFCWSDLSHVHSIFAVTLFLYLQLASRDKTDPWYWMCSGLLFGLMILVREQNAGFFGFVLYDFYVLLKNKLPKNRIVKNATLWSVACFTLYLPQLLAWKVVLGSFVATPKSANMDWGSFNVLSSMFSTYHGLFTWTPLFLLSLVGVKYLFRENKPLCWLLIVSFVFQVIINSNVVNWWASASFGNRFYLNCLPIFFILFMKLYQNKRVLTTVLSAVLGSFSLYLFLLQAQGRMQLNGYLAPGEFVKMLYTEISDIPSMLLGVFLHPTSELKTGLALSIPITAVALGVFLLFNRIINRQLNPRWLLMRLGAYFAALTIIIDLLIAVAAMTADEKKEPYRAQIAGINYHADDWMRFIKKNSNEIVVKKHIKDEKYTEAADSLHELTRFDPGNAMYALMLGLMHIKTSDYDTAGRILKTAAVMHPGNQEIDRYLRLLSERKPHEDIILRFSFDQQLNMKVAVSKESR